MGCRHGFVVDLVEEIVGEGSVCALQHSRSRIHYFSSVAQAIKVQDSTTIQRYVFARYQEVIRSRSDLHPMLACMDTFMHHTDIMNTDTNRHRRPAGHCPRLQ